jgi:hypothetical protein
MNATEEARLIRMIHHNRNKLKSVDLPTGQYLNEDHFRASRAATQAFELFTKLAEQYPLPLSVRKT